MRSLLTVSLLLYAMCGAADDKIYGLFSAGYAQSSLEDIDTDALSYKLGIGYQIHQQWFIEAGFQSFGEDNAGEDPLLVGATTSEYAGVYLAALGKAQGQYGELFYRIGVAYINPDVQTLPMNNQCAAPTSLNSQASQVRCQFDDAIVAGQLGLGFDWFLTSSLMLRTEIEWTKGTDNFESSGIYLGARYSF